jgi:hypothetical protein
MGRIGTVILAPLAALPMLCAAAGPDIDAGSLTLGEAFAQGGFSLDLRPRYNYIEESYKPKVTEIGTIRTVIRWRSAGWYGLRLNLEAINTGHIGSKRYNPNGADFATSPYPLLPDPDYTGVNQVYLEYNGVEDGVRVKVGRQVVRMDNQRWVSDNDFRQIPQLFDGVMASYTGIANTQLSAGYFNRLRDTSGEVEDIRLTIAHGSWTPLPGHAFGAYAYFHDQAVTSNFTGLANNSYRAVGVRAEGALMYGDPIEFPYTAEIAQQKPYAGGDYRIDALYWRLGAGVSAAAWSVRADYESRGSNDGRYGMQMPLTDFYAFNGWTLHFFTVPRQGLRDAWLTGRYDIGPVTLYGEYHKFRSDYASLDFGRETDLGVTWTILPNAVLRLQHGRYDPGSGQPTAPNIRKTWLTFSYNLG